MSSDEQWFDDSFRHAVYRTQSRSQLRDIGIAMHDYHDARNGFPAGATFDPTGLALHSWQTELLPYMDQRPLYDTIDMQLPWDAPVNRQPFQTEIQQLLNPGIDGPRNTSYGPTPEPPEYARSHYSANLHLFGRRNGIAIREITDGTSNTLLTGEITDELPAWGEPTNWRDPALGIGTSPGGFKGPWTSGKGHTALFTFADGSVRSISGSIDPQVLKALATPDGGEPLDEDDF